MLLSELLIRHATQQPAKAAIITADRTVTYAELHRAVDCMAAYLLDRGLQQGDRVAIRWQNSVEAVVLMLGAFRAGLLAVPIMSRLKSPEIASILEHSGARLCFSEPTLAPLVSGTAVISEMPPYTECSGRLPDIDADQPVLLIYTSGTTARPKGVIHTQRTLISGARHIATDALGPNGIALVITSLAHASGLTAGLLPGLVEAATTVLLKTFHPAEALEAIERHRCTYLFGLPPLLQLMVEEQAAHRRDVSSLRTIIGAGDSVPVVLQRRASEVFQTEIREGYGMTEVLPVTDNPRGAVRPGSIGQPSNATIRIVDSKGKDVEPGAIGEMLVSSPGNCVGYWNDPESTAQLFDGSWLRTGDLAFCDDDGYYWFKGRLKQIIVRGGSNISPQEVEEALYQHPAVLEAGVVGLPNPAFGEIPIAFISVRQGRGVQADELLAHVRRLLSDYKVPERIFFMEMLPKGLTGKVDRRRLRDILLAQADSIKDPAPSRV